MTWRDDLRRVTFTISGQKRELIGASFRGVPFFVEAAQRTGGRRAAVHEFPFRDKPFVEDLGKKAATFPIDGYVVGDDYLVQKEALRAALEDTEGPGELKHPYHGVRSAICVGMTIRETRTDGGMAVFSLEFADAPAQAPAPTIEVDTTSRVSTSADAAAAATKADFTASYDATGLPAFALASAETALGNAAAALGAGLAPVVSQTQELAVLTGQIRILTTQAASLVRRPADILDAFQGAILGLVATAAEVPGDVLGALVDAYGADLGAQAPATTTTRQRELANQVALTGALRRILAIEAARLAPRVPYASIEDATSARDQVTALIDEQAATAGDTAYPALVTLRTDVARAVPGAAVFARIVTITVRVPIPASVLAYQLYGSVDNEADIIARNQIADPDFVVGELKVLSDG